MARFAIGDVQGCAVELQQLLRRIQFNADRDELWFAGDLVNRGPDSVAVLEQLYALRAQTTIVLGNHDLHLLAIAAGTRTSAPTDTLTDVLGHPRCDLWCDWLRQQPLVHYDAQHQQVLVHAGIPPHWSLDTALAHAETFQQALAGPQYRTLLQHLYGNQPDQWSETLSLTEQWRLTANYFTRMRFCTAEGQLDLLTKTVEESKLGKAFQPWFKHPHHLASSIQVFFGHWAALKGDADAQHVTALDTGCA